MMEEKAAAKKLSKAVLELKFMKKSKEKALVQEENEERQQLYQDQLSSLHEGAEKIVMVNSYVDCFKFLPCRLSFGGMDPDIEKLNEDKLTGLYTVVKPPSKEVVTEMDADISAKEMVAHYRPTGHRPTPVHHIKQEAVEEEEERIEEPSHDSLYSSPQGQNEFEVNNIRPIYRDRMEGGRGRRGGGRGYFRRGRGGHFKRGGRGGRGGKNGGFQGGGKGSFRGGGSNKEEGLKRGNQGGFRGYLGAASRGQGRGDKRSHEGGRGHSHNSDGYNYKKMKAERD